MRSDGGGMGSDGTGSAGRSGDHEQASGSWEGHRRRALTAGLAVTPARRLAWLEEAIELAFLTGALPRKERRTER
jgi:hypothetical protein